MKFNLKRKKQKPEQITLDLKKDPLEGYYSVKRKITQVETTVEAMPYWKSFLSVTAFVLMLFLIILISAITFQNYNNLPKQIPLIYSQSALTWTLSDKDVYIIIPIVLFVALVMITRLNSQTFKFDQRLSIVVNIAVILSSVLGIIAFLQLFSFVLIY